MLRGFKNSLFREPRTGVSRSAGMWLGALLVALGSLVTALSLLGPSQDVRPLFIPFEVLLGLMLVLQGAAELLPQDRRGLAGGLRMGSIVLGLLAILTAVLRLAG